MAECKYIVLTTPVPGREDEYNHWYDNAHVPDLLRIPGVISAQRFRIATVQRSPGPFDFDYLAIYTFDSDDAQAIMDEIASRYDTDLMRMSDVMKSERWSCIFEAIGALRTPDAR